MSNFLQWNPGKLNQDSDLQYNANVMRTGGAVAGIFPKETANKLFYQLSTMVAAFGQAMANKGFTVSDADMAALVTVLSNLLTKVDFGDSAGTVCEGNDPRLAVYIPSGSKMWFYQNTAPTGWVLDATAADGILAVKANSGVYKVNGGTRAGTWTQPGHTHTGGSHTLTVNQIPAHTHKQSWNNLIGLDSDNYGYGALYKGATPAGLNTGSTGGGQAHSHGATSSNATSNAWRPLANVGIVCTRL